MVVIDVVEVDQDDMMIEAETEEEEIVVVTAEEIAEEGGATAGPTSFFTLKYQTHYIMPIHY